MNKRDQVSAGVMIAILVLAVFVKWLPAQGTTPWSNTKVVKYFRVSVTSFREDYSWDIEASSVEEARKKTFETLKRLYGKQWTTKSGKVNLYEK